MNTTLANFKHAAIAHVHLAESSSGLTNKKAPNTVGTPKAIPSSVAYVSSVALECSIKSLILKSCKVPDTATLAKHHAKLHRSLFSGSSGHDLANLAKLAGLVRHLGSDAPTSTNPAWARMCRTGRPYTLRYGTEVLSSTDALSELRLAKELHDNIANLLGRASL